jgi:hypothetical protein
VGRKMKTYYFLNVYLFSAIRIFIFFLFCLNVVLFVYHAWHITAILIPFLLFTWYIIIHIGAIKVNVKGEVIRLKIRSLFRNIQLQSPISYTSWWNYAQNAGINVFGSLMSGRARPSASDIVVCLHFIDANGKQVCFLERIELDSRFPNELQYLEKPIPVNSIVLKAQRTDKILSWLKTVLANDELTLISNDLS